MCCWYKLLVLLQQVLTFCFVLLVCCCVDGIIVGKYAMQQLVHKLPSTDGPSELQLLSNATITAVESALYEIIKTNSTHAKLVTENIFGFVCIYCIKIHLSSVFFIVQNNTYHCFCMCHLTTPQQ